MAARLSIGITTRNRPRALSACLASLEVLRPLDPEILVFDDGSDPPADVAAAASPLRVQVFRDPASPGYIVGRNRLVRSASAAAVLLLDDDTRVISLASVERALGVLERDSLVAAVAFAQAESDGRPWPAAMQPSTVDHPCIIPSFIGFAHLVRREMFLSLGGYREDFIYYGEEKDFCLRVIDHGLRTVYLPDALVAHLPDKAGRDRTRYLRFVARNDCLNSLYNDPFPRVLWSVPARFFLYFRMRRAWRIPDAWGWLWLAREVVRAASRVFWRRRPVSHLTLRTWRGLRRSPESYRVTGDTA
jgi:GT2 family glycosyltransferase